MRALIGLTLLVGGALGGLEHVTQQNQALLVPLWTNAATAEGAVPAATSAPQADLAAPPTADKVVAQTVAIADPAQPAPKTADVIVPPVKRVKPVTPAAEPVAVAAPEVKTTAVAAASVAAVVTAAKPAKTFAGRSTLGGPIPPAAPAAPKPAKQVTKQVTKQAAALNKRPGFKLTCTAAQKLDVEKQRCVAVKGKLATAAAKPKA